MFEITKRSLAKSGAKLLRQCGRTTTPVHRNLALPVSVF